MKEVHVKDGYLHNRRGPAIISGEHELWATNGVPIYDEQTLHDMFNDSDEDIIYFKLSNKFENQSDYFRHLINKLAATSHPTWALGLYHRYRFSTTKNPQGYSRRRITNDVIKIRTIKHIPYLYLYYDESLSGKKHVNLLECLEHFNIFEESA
jgi:hypothetical protein